MYLILFVLDNPDKLEDLLNAWEEAGTGGATVLVSTGMQSHVYIVASAMIFRSCPAWMIFTSVWKIITARCSPSSRMTKC